MKSVFKIVLVLIGLTVGYNSVLAQSPQVDALKIELAKAKTDSAKCIILNQLTEACTTAEWRTFNHEVFAICETHLKTAKAGSKEFLFYRKLYAGSIANLGFEATEKNEGAESIKYYTTSLQIFKELKDKQGIASSLNNIGLTHQKQGNIKQALLYYTESLKLLEEIGDTLGVAYCLNNLGYIYHGQADNEKALSYYNKGYALYKKIKDVQGMAISIINIGAVYDDKGDHSYAIEKYNESYKLYESIGNLQGMAACLNNLGTVFDDLKKPDDALANYIKCLKLYEEIGDKHGTANTLSNIGWLYVKQKKYNLALEYSLKSMEISKEIGFPQDIKSAAVNLYYIYKLTGKYDLAIENYKLNIKMRDSISNEDNRKATYKQQLKYEYDKKTATDSVAHVKEKFVQAAEIKKQEAELTMRKNRQYALFGGLGLVIVFAGFMYNRFKITQKQKAIIELQKTEVEAQKNIVDEKQKELLDSINYAERIQKAHLPTHAYIAKNLDRLKA
ncbi:MAG: tetratricopeptide repeat protein [Bacteroidia bacterium]|nr:tetratricopeptide repeat protein [Bacteroidia bacterium]